MVFDGLYTDLDVFQESIELYKDFRYIRDALLSLYWQP